MPLTKIFCPIRTNESIQPDRMRNNPEKIQKENKRAT
ncbi:uncharacterized protein METZ01_LOCUS217513 [marine metagenome]|uniref:Uncharacterized protein n=1 Tax=marine metagenome TaxID=408172 RepID=A0A382FPT0_9ZZZZ